MERLVQVRNDNTSGRTGLCLEPHDLCAAKLLAGRGKDHEFVESLLQAHLVDAAIIRDRVMLTRTDSARATRASAWLDATSSAPAPNFLPPPSAVDPRDRGSKAPPFDG